MVSGGRGLVSRITPVFLSSHDWIMMVPFTEIGNTKGEWGYFGGCGAHKEDLGGEDRSVDAKKAFDKIQYHSEQKLSTH